MASLANCLASQAYCDTNNQQQIPDNVCLAEASALGTCGVVANTGTPSSNNTGGRAATGGASYATGGRVATGGASYAAGGHAGFGASGG